MTVATPTERWLTVDGLRLKALDWGPAGKPPVLLLHGMAMYAWTWEPLDLWPRLGEIRCPTLLVRGAESPVLRQDHAERMVQAIPDCQLVVVPRAGHGIGTDNPGVYERCIRQFLLGETVTDAVGNAVTR